MLKIMVKRCVTYSAINKIFKRAFHNEIHNYCVCVCVYGVYAYAHMFTSGVCVCMYMCVCPIWVSQRGRHGEPNEIYFPFKPQGSFEISLTLIKPTPGSWAWWAWWTFVLKSNLACQRSFFPSSHFIVVSSRGSCFKGYDQSKGHFFWDIFYID